MIRIPNAVLPVGTQTALARYQQEINAILDYENRVRSAKENFSRYNNPQNKTFKIVRATLTDLCCGARRCMYCEDSCADEVEHFKPKDLYPEYVFVWENYLYSCGRCNVPKNNKFAIYSKRTGSFLDITRHKNATVIPPEKGDAVLIDPRREDPLDFLELDLSGTFFFLPRGRKRSRIYERAEYTIDILALNRRPELSKARHHAYRGYHAILEQYVNRKQANVQKVKLALYCKTIQEMHHPSVWKEMQRQAALLLELKPLFQAAPEALLW
jgi:uncharacterized protein (TIGR02646 family)